MAATPASPDAPVPPYAGRGTVYLLHFDQRYQHAGHYTGKPASSGLLEVLRRADGAKFAQLALPMWWRHACGVAVSWALQRPGRLARAGWGPWPTPVVACRRLRRKLMPAGLRLPGAAGAPPPARHGLRVVGVCGLGVVVAAAVVLGTVPAGAVVVGTATGAVVVGTATVVVGADRDGEVVDVAGARVAGGAGLSASATTTPTEVLAPCRGRLPTKLASGCLATASMPVIAPTAIPNASTAATATRRQRIGSGCALLAPSSLGPAPSLPTRRRRERRASVSADASVRVYTASAGVTRMLPSAAPIRVPSTPKNDATTAPVTAASAPASNLGTRNCSIPHLQVGVGGRRRCRGGPQARPDGSPAAPASARILPTEAVSRQVAPGQAGDRAAWDARSAGDQVFIAAVLQRPQFKAAQGPEGPKVAHDDPEHGAPRRVHESQRGCALSARRAEILLGGQESCSSMRACRARWLSRDNARAALSNALTNSRQIQHWADNLDQRIAQHQRGAGARLVEVITQAGIGFRVARLWPGASKAQERSLKNSGGASRYCLICKSERKARGEPLRPPRHHSHHDRADQPPTPRRQQLRGRDGVGAVPTRGVHPKQARQFMALNPAFARPATASLAQQWGRVRGREEIEALGPRVTGARFDENQPLSQKRTTAVVRRAVQARVQARQRELADQAEQARTRAVAARTHQRLAGRPAQRPSRSARRREPSRQPNTAREASHETP
jgi:hypothetical protein